MSLSLFLVVQLLVPANDVADEQATWRWPARGATRLPLGSRFFFQEQDGCTALREVRLSVNGQEMPPTRIGASHIFPFPAASPGESFLLRFEITDPLRPRLDEQTITFEEVTVPVTEVAPEVTVEAFEGQLPACGTNEWYHLEFKGPKDRVGVIIYNQAGEPTGLALDSQTYLVAQRGPCFSAAALNALGQTGPRSDLVCPGGCSGVESKGAQGFGLWGLLGVVGALRRMARGCRSRPCN